MKVLHVVASAERRGAELFAGDLVPRLSRAGLTQRVIVLREGRAPRVDFQEPTTILRSRRRRLPGVRFDRHIGGQLRNLAHEWGPDVIQAHGGESLKHVVLSQVNGAPVVYRRIGSAPVAMTRGLSRIAHAHLMRRASHIVAVAEALREETIEVFAVPPDRVTVIPNAVDPARIRPRLTRRAVRESLGIPSSAPVVLSLGALTWEKDPLAHLAVSMAVLAERPDAMHLFVGDGPLRPALERAVQERRLEGSVLFLGSREDVPDLLAAIDLMLLASRVEGLPGCLIEAGMSGVPVAAYAVAGVPEIVVDGVTGLLIPGGHRAALAAAATRLLGDEGARRAMGEAARDRCRRLFDIRSVSPRYIELYERMVR
jgi:glycosyltransferase involved in cell wall biosynthesis